MVGKPDAAFFPATLTSASGLRHQPDGAVEKWDQTRRSGGKLRPNLTERWKSEPKLDAAVEKWAQTCRSGGKVSPNLTERWKSEPKCYSDRNITEPKLWSNQTEPITRLFVVNLYDATKVRTRLKHRVGNSTFNRVCFRHNRMQKIWYPRLKAGFRLAALICLLISWRGRKTGFGLSRSVAVFSIGKYLTMLLKIVPS